MVNSGKFAKRLELILKHYDLSAASFADSIDVGRSSISHILSGRNKPSLDFVLKIVQNYPEVELYWLLNGKGNFPKTSEISESSSLSQDKPVKSKEIFQNKIASTETPALQKEKKISKIVIFYSDGSFEAFEN